MMQILDRALPLVPAGLQATAVMIKQDRIVVTARTIGTVATCPTCGTGSDHVHSRYWRTIADLPWQGRKIVLRVQVRRFRCRHCGSRIFAERLPEIARKGRRTGRLMLAQAQIGLVLGGEPGARLASKLAMPVSGDTVLRLIRKLPAPPWSPPRVIGVDDWAVAPRPALRNHRVRPGTRPGDRPTAGSLRRSSARVAEATPDRRAGQP